MKKEYGFRHAEFNCEYRYPIIFHPIHNFKEWKAYRWRRKYLLKNGFGPEAFWDTDHWFIDTMSDILQKHYEWNKEFLDTKDDRNIELQNDIESMIKHLKIMKEYDELELDDKEEKSREEFFKLFFKNFHALWN